MDYREQYDRYVAMIEETIERILPQNEMDCTNDMQIHRNLCEVSRMKIFFSGCSSSTMVRAATAAL